MSSVQYHLKKTNLNSVDFQKSYVFSQLQSFRMQKQLSYIRSIHDQLKVESIV